MITIETILQKVTSQNLMNTCTFETQGEVDFFRRIATVEGMLPKIEYLSTARVLKKFPIYHLVYDAIADEFQLNTDFFDKQDDQITWVNGQYGILRWTLAFNNQYILTFPAGVAMGNIVKQHLPVIKKT